VRGRISEYIPNPTFDVVAAPGAQEAFYRSGNPEGKSYREIVGKPIRSIPAFRAPQPRLELMDAMGVDRALVYPTLASRVEERMKNDVLQAHAAIHALNQWIFETWRFDYEDRIFATPIVTLPIVERAIEELEWVVERGARCVPRRGPVAPPDRGRDGGDDLPLLSLISRKGSVDQRQKRFLTPESHSVILRAGPVALRTGAVGTRGDRHG
jgi:hypothetical protein